VRDIVARLDPDDLALWGHPIEAFWEPLDRAGGAGKAPVKKKLDAIDCSARRSSSSAPRCSEARRLRKLLGRLRLGADVLLRE